MRYTFNTLLSIFLVISVSCKSGNEQKTEQSLSSLENNSQPDASEDKRSDQLAITQQQLQGMWKRISYPYGTIEFDNDQVKFTAGEGSIEDPVFKSYRISDRCNGSEENSSREEGYDVLQVNGQKECDHIKMRGDTLIFKYPGSDNTIKYLKTNVESNEMSNSIPERFQGTWAQTTAHCEVRNHYRIMIDQQYLHKFETRSALLETQQSDNNVFKATFSTEINEGNTQTSEITMELQNNGERLQLSTLESNSESRTSTYIRCE